MKFLASPPKGREFVYLREINRQTVREYCRVNHCTPKWARMMMKNQHYRRRNRRISQKQAAECFKDNVKPYYLYVYDYHGHVICTKEELDCGRRLL